MGAEEGVGGEEAEKVERLFPMSEFFQKDKVSYLTDLGKNDKKR